MKITCDLIGGLGNQLFQVATTLATAWDNNFEPISNKKELIQICGHYVISSPSFVRIKEKYSYIDIVIKDNLLNKLNQLYGQ